MPVQPKRQLRGRLSQTAWMCSRKSCGLTPEQTSWGKTTLERSDSGGFSASPLADCCGRCYGTFLACYEPSGQEWEEVAEACNTDGAADLRFECCSRVVNTETKPDFKVGEITEYQQGGGRAIMKFHSEMFRWQVHVLFSIT